MTLPSYLYLDTRQPLTLYAAGSRAAGTLPSGVKQPLAPTHRNPQSFAAELDRLSSLALAAGKDFNDELTLILNHAEVSLDLLGAEHPAITGLIELQHAAMRCAETTRCLLLLTVRARETVRCAKVRAGRAYPGD